MEQWWTSLQGEGRGERPVDWVERLGLAVKVHLKGSLKGHPPLEGFLYTVDPELHHLMLLRFRSSVDGNDVVERIVVLAHAITSVEFGTERAPLPIADVDDVARLLRPASSDSPHTRVDTAAIAEAHQTRRAVVRQLLEKACIPHEEDEASGVITVMGGVAAIDPPYNAASCRSRNVIVLQRLQTILATLVPVHVDAQQKPCVGSA